MRLRTPIRGMAEMRASKAEREETVALVLGKAVENVIRSKRAVLASKVRLAAMRRNRKGNP